jgi:hypothetical protein
LFGCRHIRIPGIGYRREVASSTTLSVANTGGESSKTRIRTPLIRGRRDGRPEIMSLRLQLVMISVPGTKPRLRMLKVKRIALRFIFRLLGNL